MLYCPTLLFLDTFACIFDFAKPIDAVLATRDFDDYRQLPIIDMISKYRNLL